RLGGDSVVLHLTELGDESWRGRADFAARPVASGAESFIPGTASCRARVDDAAALHQELAAAGALHARTRLRDQWWGDRDFGVLDPDGNLVVFYQPDAVPRSAPPRA